MVKIRKGPMPIVGTCRGCGAPFASKYAAKTHVCSKGERS
jgi:hypothetical protein